MTELSPPPARATDAYVHAAMTLHGYQLDAAATARVCDVFAQLAALSAPLQALPLPDTLAPAPCYWP